VCGTIAPDGAGEHDRDADDGPATAAESDAQVSIVLAVASIELRAPAQSAILAAM
jgi:hypothetical protein